MATEDAPATGPDLKQGIDGSSLEEGALLLGQVEGEAVLLARSGGEVFAIGAKCTHYGGPLAEGMLVNGMIRCPWHHGGFDLRTGDVVRPPAFNPLPCWEVSERDGIVRVAGKREPAARATRSRSAHPESVLILGGGAAGHHAAETLRREGYDRPVTIIEAGPFGPYDRPNLSKDYLAGNAPEEWMPLRPDAWYAEHGIDLLLGTRAVRLDPGTRHLVIHDGTTRTFGSLLIATGAEPIDPPGPVPEQRVHLLRTLADSRAIIAAAEQAKHAVVIGASFIGLEVAASLRARGLDVTVVSPDVIPLAKLGPEIGRVVRAKHEQEGVRFRLGRKVARAGRKNVVLDNGDTVPADLVVAGIGVRPSIALAQRAGLAVDGGILVDESLETSAPGIFAAGDVASWPDARSGERIRVEHWVVAQRMGQAAARSMLAAPGERRPFDAVPFFWSQHYDMAISMTGHAASWDSVEIAGDLAAHDGSVSFRSGERVLAVATIGRDHASLAAEASMERQGARA